MDKEKNNFEADLSISSLLGVQTHTCVRPDGPPMSLIFDTAPGIDTQFTITYERRFAPVVSCSDLTVSFEFPDAAEPDSDHKR